MLLAPSVTYLGHCIDAQGLHPVEEKVKALQEAPTPKNVTELKSFLGMLSYHSEFVNRISSLTKITKTISALAMEHRTPRSFREIQEVVNLITTFGSF